VQELKPGDSAKRVAYFKWFLDFLDREGEDILDVTFFRDEAYFHLSGYINSQNSCIWCAHNPHAFHESPLHDENTVRRVSNVWRLAGDTLSLTCNFLYCNHQVHRDVLITQYFYPNL
jgi:hypothetical protein